VRRPTNRRSNRPRVTISISGNSEPSDADLLTLDLPPGLTVQDLKGFVEAETNLAADTQNFYLNGRPLTHATQTLDEAGIKDGEMLAVLIRRRADSQPNASASASAATPTAQRVPDPEAVRQHVLANPQAQDDLRRQKPELFALLNDSSRWRQAFEMGRRQEQEADRERRQQIALLNEDPFNIEAQKKIEEIIRQDRVIENLQHAYEHNPEGTYLYHPPYPQ
jgi:DNA damage-inducible protein 1